MGSSNPLLRPASGCPSAAFLFRSFYILLACLLCLHFFYFSSHPRSHLDAATPTSTPPRAKEPISPPCDYSRGKWVRSSAPLLYNGTSCAAVIKDAQNCMAHGRPDTSYLRYRWRPSSCRLPRFRPATLLRLLRNRHLVFVGDSLARNQAESLVCLLSSHSPPSLVHTDGSGIRKNRRWLFPSHNLTVSLFWSPFLVHGVEKSPPEREHNELHLHAVDDRWVGNSSAADVIVLSASHWFLHRAVYLYGDTLLGCHAVANCTEVDFYDAYSRAHRTALSAIVRRKAGVGSPPETPSLVVVTTFPPAHFEGEWDKFGACAKTEPETRAEVGWMENEMRRRQVEEADAASRLAAEEGAAVSVAPLDVTLMSAMRPDGHPGAYMYAFPYRDGARERVQNDCVHWCMPGPIDTWNEVFLQLVKRWSLMEPSANVRG